jgi:hypothetical protein
MSVVVTLEHMKENKKITKIINETHRLFIFIFIYDLFHYIIIISPYNEP